MVDSELFVKVAEVDSATPDSESLTANARNLTYVQPKQENRDRILSDYLRHRLERWLKEGEELQDGREQLDLATKGGFSSPSVIAMVKKGGGVGAKTTPCWAKAFDFASVEAMIDAAHEWRRGLGESLDRRLADPAFRQGVELVGGIMPPPTDAEVRTIAADFVAPRFDGRDPMWWLNTVGAELKRDRDRQQAVANAKHAEQLEKRRAARQQEVAWGESAKLKHRVGELKEEALRAEQKAHAEVEKKKKRRKLRLRAI